MADTLNSLLAAERAQLEEETVSLQRQVELAQERLAKARRRLDLVRRLLDEEQGMDTASAPHARQPSPNGAVEHVCDIAEQVLAERAAQPMYYKELAVEIIKRGGALGGRNPAGLLTARLVADERFVRPTAKGFYALRRDYPNARNVGARRRRSARSRR